MCGSGNAAFSPGRTYDDYRLAVCGFTNFELTVYCVLYTVNFILTMTHHLIGYEYPIIYRVASVILMCGMCFHLLCYMSFGNKVKEGFNTKKSIMNKCLKYFKVDKEEFAVDTNSEEVQQFINRYFKGRVFIVQILKYTIILSTTGTCLTLVEGTNGVFMGSWVYVLINYSMVAIVVSLIFFMSNRFWYAAPVISVYLFITLAGIFYTVVLHRGTALMPGELISNLKTLLMTTGGQEIKYPYHLLPWGDLVSSIKITSIMMMVVLFRTFSGFKGAKYSVVSEEFSRSKFIQLRGPVGIRSQALVILFGGVIVTSIALQSGIAVGAWEYTYSRAQKGLLFSFVKMLDTYKLEMPKGYELYKDEVNGYSYTMKKGGAAEGLVNPNVLIIMNEAFSDIEAYLDIDTTEEVLPFFNELRQKDYVESGFVVTPYVGGMTCNTEFEVMTGLSTSFLPFMVSPYSNLKSPMTSFIDYFNDLGYGSYYVHPFWGSSWDRDTALQNIAFKKIYFGDAFGQNQEKSEKWYGDTTAYSNLGAFGSADELEYVRSFISDRENYKKVMSTVRESSNPVFVYNTTVQNHGFYTEDVKGNLEYTIKISSTLKNRAIKNSLTQYLNLINLSDQALRELIQELDKLDEPVVVCFFGDHIPPLEFDMGNLQLPMKYSVDTDSEENVLKQLWLTRAPYFIWSNEKYRELTGNTVGRKREIFSTNYLLRHVAEYCGLPESAFMGFLKKLEKEYPIISPIEGVVTVGNCGALNYDKYAAFNYKQFSMGRTKN